MDKEQKILEQIEAHKARLKKERVKQRKMEKATRDRAFACFGEFFFEKLKDKDEESRNGSKQSLLSRFERPIDQQAIEAMFKKLE